MRVRLPGILSAAMGILLLAASVFAKVDPGTGSFTFAHPETGKRVVVFYVKSAAYDPGNPPILVLHGMNRNPWDYRDAWRQLAEEHALFVFVPYFRETDYPGTVAYNLGNVFASETDLSRNPESLWSYRLPDIVFDHLQKEGDTTAAGYFAFGHSAGSQFLHRKVAFVPDERMLLAVAANAGWYTFPDLEVQWPYGYGGTGLRKEEFVPYLASRLFVLLGDRDTDPDDSSLRKAPEAMRQGKHRLERGHAFYAAARQLAEEMEAPFHWQIEEVPGVGHDNAGMAPAAVRKMLPYMRRHTGEEETP